MKSTLLTLAATLLLVGPAAAQGTAPAAAPAPAELSGRLTNALGDALTVSWQPEALNPQEQRRTVRPDVDGNFMLRVPVAKPTLAQLNIGDEEISVFLEPGDALELRGDALELAASTKFSAAADAAQPGAAANNYLLDAGRRYAGNEQYQVLPDNIKMLEKGFLEFLSYRREHEDALLKQAGRRGHFTAAFQAFAEAEVAYAYADDRLMYASLREQTNPDQQLELSAGYYDFLRESSLLPGPAAALTSPHYQDFLLDYVHYQAQATGHRPGSPDYYPTCYRLADQLLPAGGSSLARPLLLGRVVRETIEQGHVAHAQAMLASYAASAQAPAAWVALLRDEATTHQALAIGSPAPELPLHLASGRDITLKDLRGKLVYVVFWDSRYPAGQRLLPYLKETAAAVADQPIEIVMAAMDDCAVNWQQKVANVHPQFSGTHACVPADSQAAVRQRYNLARLPCAILIAEDGTLLNLHPRDLSSRALQDDLRAAVGRGAAYRAVALSNL